MRGKNDNKLGLYFFENVRAVCKKNDWAISSIETCAGVKTGYFKNMERKNSCPTIRVAKAFSDVVGYSIDELIMDPETFRKIEFGEE